jgi:alkanesulfonate monooxygenase SsuD/methylene tetrahydromethanopterin reductase-like flavin-dependent oxidoreductase (luciferase family)
MEVFLPADRSSPTRRHLEVPPGVPAAFDLLADVAVCADRAGWASLSLPAGAHAFDALTLLASLAPRTSHIGLIAGIDPAVIPPYTAARRLAALDHISGGRAGWRLTASVSDAQRAEYVQVLRALWDSWDDGAHRIDQGKGVYVDISGVHPIAHRGAFYSVAGPLDIPRPIQGHPVYFGMKGDAADILLDGDVVVLPLNVDSWRAIARTPGATPIATGISTSDTRTLRAALDLPPASRALNARKA